MIGPDFSELEIEALTDALPQINKALDEFNEAALNFADSVTAAINAAIDKGEN